MIPKIPINYYPFINQGHTLKMAGKIDPWRMYCNKVQYGFAEIAVFPDFNFRDKNDPDWIEVHYTHYLLLQVNGNIDYNVLTSLN